jgi:capsular exopolysaccharide synthesis family protein
MHNDFPTNGNPLGGMIPQDDLSPSRSAISVLGAPAPEPSPSVGPMSIVHALRRRWMLALPLGILLACMLAGGGWVLMTPKYTASAYLRLGADERPLVFQTADQGRSDFKIFKNTQAQLMKTPFVLNAALREPTVNAVEEVQNAENKIDYLQQEIKVTYPGDGELMQVTYSSNSGASAIAVVNAVVDAYLDEIVAAERKERLDRLQSLETVHDEAENKVRASRNKLKEFAVSLGTGDSESLTVAQQSALQQYGQMQEKLAEVQYELMQAEGQLKVANQIASQFSESAKGEGQEVNPTDAAAKREVEINAMIEKSPEVASLRNEIELLQVRMSSLASTYGTGFPAYRQAKQEMEQMQQLLAKRREVAREPAVKAFEDTEQLEQYRRATGTSANGQITQYDAMRLSTRVEVLSAQEKLLQSKVDELSEETKKLGKTSIDIELMRSEIAAQEGVLQRVGEEIERTNIELKTASRVRLISKADSATPPEFMKRITRTAALGFFGLFAPLGLLIGWDLTHRRVDNADAVSNTLSIPTLGVIPTVNQKVLFRDPPAGNRLVSERTRLLEAVDSMAAMVQFHCQSSGSKVLLVTSAIPEEGKSTVACQLADSLARAGNRVMLVDFDLRRPSVHRYLRLPNDLGVGDVLDGRATVDGIMQKLDKSGLSILSAGSSEQSMQAMCTNGSIERLLAKLRDEYDIVILDSSPILPVADTRSLVKFTDSVILTLVRDRSRLPLVSQASSILASYRANIMGGIIIGGGGIGYTKNYYYERKLREPRKLDESASSEQPSAVS